MPWLIAVAAAGLGAAIGGVPGFFIGGLLGYVVSRELDIRKRLRELKETQNRLHQLQVWANEMKAWSAQAYARMSTDPHPDTGPADTDTPDTDTPDIDAPDTDAPDTDTPDIDTPALQTPTSSRGCLHRFPGQSPPRRRPRRAWTSPHLRRPLLPIPRPGHPTLLARPHHQPNRHQPSRHQPHQPTDTSTSRTHTSGTHTSPRRGDRGSGTSLGGCLSRVLVRRRRHRRGQPDRAPAAALQSAHPARRRGQGVDHHRQRSRQGGCAGVADRGGAAAAGGQPPRRHHVHHRDAPHRGDAVRAGAADHRLAAAAQEPALRAQPPRRRCGRAVSHDLHLLRGLRRASGRPRGGGGDRGDGGRRVPVRRPGQPSPRGARHHRRVPGPGADLHEPRRSRRGVRLLCGAERGHRRSRLVQDLAPAQPAGPRLHIRDLGLLAVAALRRGQVGRRAAAHRGADPAVPGHTGVVRHPGGARSETAVDGAAGVRHALPGVRPPVPGRRPHRPRHGCERGRPGAGARRAGGRRPQARAGVPPAGGGQHRARGRLRGDRGASGIRRPSDGGRVGGPGRSAGLDRLPAHPVAGRGRGRLPAGDCGRRLPRAPAAVPPLPAGCAAGRQRVLPRRGGSCRNGLDDGPDGPQSARLGQRGCCRFVARVGVGGGLVDRRRARRGRLSAVVASAGGVAVLRRAVLRRGLAGRRPPPVAASSRPGGGYRSDAVAGGRGLADQPGAASARPLRLGGVARVARRVLLVPAVR